MKSTTTHFTDTKTVPAVQEADLAILNDLEALQRDPATAELIRTGRTMGCFYIESPSMRSLFQRMHCTCYEDVVAASSIIRPGVAESGMMKAYVERFCAARNEGIADGGWRIAEYESSGEKREVEKQAACQPVLLSPPAIQHSQFNIHNSHSAIRNPQSAIYIHPKLAEVLSETFGVMVYQEDVLKVVHELAGMSLGEADILRRAMSGKAGSHEAMASITERFFAGCRARGVPEPVIEELWRQIETFARFSFCKGHSAAFAVLSYQVAYLKAHHPAEFMAAVLSNGGGYYGAAAYIQECRRMGLRVLGPDVNESEINYVGRTEEKQKERYTLEPRISQIYTDYSKTLSTKSAKEHEEKVFCSRNKIPGACDKNARGRNTAGDCSQSVKSVQSVVSVFPSGFVRVGFAAINNFPLELAEQILRVRRERPFDSFADFLRRMRPTPEATEKLIRVGAFDRFGVPREQLCLELDVHFRERTDHGEAELFDENRYIADRGSRFADCEQGGEKKEVGKVESSSDINPPHVANKSQLPIRNPQSAIRNSESAIRHPQLERRLADEIELLGYGVTAHPLELLPKEVWRGTVAARDLRRYVGRRVTLIGWAIASKLIRTHQSREFMKFLSLEDLTDTFEVTLFPRAYRRYAPLTLGVGPFRVRGKVEDDLGALNVVADHIELVTDAGEGKRKK